MPKKLNETHRKQIKEIIAQLYDLYCPFNDNLSEIVDYNPLEIKEQIFSQILNFYEEEIDDARNMFHYRGNKYEEVDLFDTIKGILINTIFAKNSFVTKIFKPRRLREIEYECFRNYGFELHRESIKLMVELLKVMDFPPTYDV